MFAAPDLTLHNSLSKIFDNPKEYLADVCFEYASCEIWAHRALILVRAPIDFINKYIPEILNANDDTDNRHPLLRLNISQHLSADILTTLLQYWYTGSIIPAKSLLESNISVINEDYSLDNSIVTTINALSDSLGTSDLLRRSSTLADYDQLILDMKRLLHEHIAADVTIQLIPSSSRYSITEYPVIASFPAHRFILAAQSLYFYSLFCSPFQESRDPAIYLADDLFNESVVDLILHFLYTDQINIKCRKETVQLSTAQSKQQHLKHSLNTMQKAFYASDYLSHTSLDQALLHEIESLCHNFKCNCAECAILLPSMLAWSDQCIDRYPKLRRTLILLYSDPVSSLISPLWTQRSFSVLITALVPSPDRMAESVMNSVILNDPLFRARPSQTLVHEIEERLFYNVTKHNAIHVLHSLHLCLSHIRAADWSLVWSRSILNLIEPLLTYTVKMVSDSFDFYCTDYPILLSCVDGIGAVFSIDFLELLLSDVLTKGINESNAAIIYHGIVHHLVGRQEVLKNTAIHTMLIKSRQQCALFIASHWSTMKSQASQSLMKLDKQTLKCLGDDIHVPYRSLIKPTLFTTFKIKKKASTSNFFSRSNSSDIFNKHERNSQQITKPSSSRRRHLSLSNLMTRSSEDPIQSLKKPLSGVGKSMFAPYHSTPSLPLENSNEINKRSSMCSDASTLMLLTEQLLSSDFTPREPISTTKSSCLTFQLPSPGRLPTSNLHTAAGSASTKHSHNNGLFHNIREHKKLRRSRINLEDDDKQERKLSSPEIGDKITLLKRPLPTMGVIKYMGPVQFADGIYVGIELESRCRLPIYNNKIKKSG
ncbi:hypothetical protein BDB01DRAFT_780223 [Pilobolus umbonatus]|nr:hypothetical protein BDB01DRAFT_780223 [Pilobolus umbonatus]